MLPIVVSSSTFLPDRAEVFVMFVSVTGSVLDIAIVVVVDNGVAATVIVSCVGSRVVA